LRIIYFVKNFHPAHAGIVAALQSDGHKVSLVVHKAKQGSVKNGATLVDVEVAELQSWKTMTKVFRSKKTDQCFPDLVWVFRLLWQEKPDSVIVYSHHYSGVLISLMSRALKIHASTLADSPHRPKRFRQWVIHALTRRLRTRTMLHTGEFGRPGQPYALGPLLGDSYLAPYPVEPPLRGLLRPERPDSQPLRVLCMTCANPQRSRIELPLEAVAEAGLDTQVELLFARSSSSRDLERIRTTELKLGLGKSQLFIDLNDLEIRNLFLNAVDVLVYPAENVDYGQTVGEALAHGLPVICSDSVGAGVLIEDGVNGLRFKSGCADSLGEAISLLEGSRERVQQMSVNATRRAAETHSYRAWLDCFYSASKLVPALSATESR